MHSIKAGLLGGLIGTIAVCGMMIVKTASHQLPELHVIRTLAEVLGTQHYGVAILTLFFIGVVAFGGLFGILNHRIPGRSYFIKGLVLGVVAWLGMMLLFMPLAGAGIFAIERGTWTVPVATLVYHLVYGAVLGLCYGSIVGPETVAGPTRRDTVEQ